ncbi:MAG: hypothetical protein ACTHWO_04765 [Nesterenkonia sp.]
MVSGTGERTIATWAALALVVGLVLSAAPAAYSATTPNPEESLVDETATQTTVEDVEDDDDNEGSPSPDDVESETQPPSPTPTPTPSPTPPPTPTDSPEPTDPTDPTEPTDPASSNGPNTSDPEFSCPEGGGVDPGEAETVECFVPDGFAVDLGATQTEYGNVVLEGSSLTFTAAPTVYGTQSVPVAVIGISPDGEETTARVTFTVYGTDDPSPSPTEEPSPEVPTSEPEPAPSESEMTTPSDTSDPTDSESSAPEPERPDDEEEDIPTESEAPGPTTSTPASPLPAPPGAPESSSTEPTQDGLPPLPVPGMPGPEARNTLPEPTADNAKESAGDDDDGADEDETEDDEGILAQTGPEQVAWAGSLAATSIVLGTAALTLARRQTQRRSGT